MFNGVIQILIEGPCMKKNLHVLFRIVLLGLLTGRTVAKPIIPPKLYHDGDIPLKNGQRHSSFPYISGDTFRNIAQFYVDETRTPIDPDDVKYGDIIFIQTRMKEFFFKVIHPLIKTRYILISHNCFSNATEQFAHMLDDEKLIAWFAKNIDIDHPKLLPIPLGIGNSYKKNGNIKSLNGVMTKTQNIKKDKLLYLNLTAKNNPKVRQEVLKLFKHQAFCHKGKNKPWKDYLIDVASSKFVLSPRGTGEDCYRTWEALLMGSIPIVKSSAINSLFEDLPVVIVNEWSEATEDFLNKKYGEMSSKSYKMEKIYAAYWLNMIFEVQKTSRNMG